MWVWARKLPACRGKRWPSVGGRGRGEVRCGARKAGKELSKSVAAREARSQCDKPSRSSCQPSTTALTRGLARGSQGSSAAAHTRRCHRRVLAGRGGRWEVEGGRWKVDWKHSLMIGSQGSSRHRLPRELCRRRLRLDALYTRRSARGSSPEATPAATGCLMRDAVSSVGPTRAGVVAARLQKRGRSRRSCWSMGGESRESWWESEGLEWKLCTSQDDGGVLCTATLGWTAGKSMRRPSDGPIAARSEERAGLGGSWNRGGRADDESHVRDLTGFWRGRLGCLPVRCDEVGPRFRRAAPARLLALTAKL